jgi:hypothetical protein
MSYKLPEQYITQMFQIYAGYVKYNPASSVYMGGCPICREGKSWGKKSRLYWIPKYGNIHCKNDCSRSWTPVDWIMEVSGKSYEEIREEAKEYEFVPVENIIRDQQRVFTSKTLPDDSINLFNETEVQYFTENEHVKLALEIIERRRLRTAVNAPRAMYMSLTDYSHSNRITIPFYDELNKLSFFQSRAMYGETNKYISKGNGIKTLFGFDKVVAEIPYVFIFEGPIDAMFMRNGVAIGGVEFTSRQKQQMQSIPFHKRVWILDNPNIDNTANSKIMTLPQKGDLVFNWGRVTAYKDFNDICVAKKIDEIPKDFVLNNCTEVV